MDTDLADAPLSLASAGDIGAIEGLLIDNLHVARMLPLYYTNASQELAVFAPAEVEDRY